MTDPDGWPATIETYEDQRRNREANQRYQYEKKQARKAAKKDKQVERSKEWWRENVPGCDISHDGTAISFETRSGGGVTCSGGQVWRDYL